MNNREDHIMDLHAALECSPIAEKLPFGYKFDYEILENDERIDIVGRNGKIHNSLMITDGSIPSDKDLEGLYNDFKTSQRKKSMSL